MIRNHFAPVLNRSRLYSVWIQTGNPAQPLARIWIDSDLRMIANQQSDRTEPCQLCA